MANSVQLNIRADNVAVITLDAPGQKLNLLSQAFMMEFAAAVKQVSENKDVRGLVIISGKDDFVAGANLEEIKSFQNRTAIEAAEKAREGRVIFQQLADLPIRTVAAISGLCLGGGLELTLAAKVRIASTDRKTKLAFPEVKLGFLPGWGGNTRTPHLIGIQKSIELITTGAEIDAKKAWRYGLVDETVEKDKLLERAVEIALGATPRRSKKILKQRAMDFLLEGNPVGRAVLKSQAVKLVKAKSKGYLAPNEIVKQIFESVEKGVNEKTFDREALTAGALVSTPVSKNLLGIFFAVQESKKMPENLTPSIMVKKVGVIGAGAMGHGIAQSALFAGYDVVLLDVAQPALDKGVADIHALFDGLVKRGKFTKDEVDAKMAKLTPTLKYSDMADCDLVIEAVAEVMYVKKLVRHSLEEAISKPFIFATNTSSLSVGEMAKGYSLTEADIAANEKQADPNRKKKEIPAARHPDNVVGLHFFNPVHKMPLVEVVRGETTSEDAVAVGKSFAMKLGKTTVVTADSPGFVVNRILTPYMVETVRLLEAGVPAADIDKAMKAFGMPMGPLELMDEVGLDICAHVVNTMHGALGQRVAPPDILSVIKERQLLGKKGGKGIYLWDQPHGKKVFDKKTKKYLFNDEILSAVKAPKAPKHITEIQDRLALVMVNEAIRCLEEGIVSDPSQLDLAMIFGTGYPPFRGGVLRYADQEGLRVIEQKLTWLAEVASENYRPAKLLKQMVKDGANFYA